MARKYRSQLSGLTMAEDTKIITFLCPLPTFGCISIASDSLRGIDAVLTTLPSRRESGSGQAAIVAVSGYRMTNNEDLDWS